MDLVPSGCEDGALDAITFTRDLLSCFLLLELISVIVVFPANFQVIFIC